MTKTTALTFFIARHGETVANVEGRLQGHLDTPLTSRGRRQARAVGKCLAEQLAGRTPAAFYSSPLGRAAETARIIAEELNLAEEQIVFTDLLKELNFGRWCGLTPDEIKERFPEDFKLRELDKWNYRFHKGESYVDLAARLDSWFGSLPSDGIVVSVGHGVVNRVLRKKLLGLGIEAAFSYLQANDCLLRIAQGAEEKFETGAVLV